MDPWASATSQVRGVSESARVTCRGSFQLLTTSRSTASAVLVSSNAWSTAVTPEAFAETPKEKLPTTPIGWVPFTPPDAEYPARSSAKRVVSESSIAISSPGVSSRSSAASALSGAS